MEIRRRQLFDRNGAAEAPEALAPLDPASLVTECFGDSDIVILALRNMQDFVPAITRAADPPARKAEEIRVRLLAERLVHRHAVPKRIAERAREMLESPALCVGHGHEAVFRRKPLQRFDGIRKGGPEFG